MNENQEQKLDNNTQHYYLLSIFRSLYNYYNVP